MVSALQYVLAPLRHRLLLAAEVPCDLASVTSIAHDEEVEPGLAGMTREGVDAIWRAAEGLYATGMHPGLSITLRRQGRIVLKRAIGHARGNGPDEHGATKVPMTPATPVCLFSASKAMAAMTVHLLSERKQLSLLDPVSHYVPEFGRNGKRDITIYQLLCHKAGIPTIPTEGLDVAELLLDPKAILKLIYDTAPEKPGHHHAYHALTAGFVVADLVERVSGQGFRAFFREHIAAPLGLRSLDFGARGPTVPRIARNYVTGFRLPGAVNLYLKRAIGTTLEHAVETSNDPRYYRAVIPAGNGVGTADDACAFFQCLLNGGRLGRKRAFQPLTVRRAIAEVGKPEIDRSLFLPMRYSAGMMLGAKGMGVYGPDTTQAFGHLGFANTLVWADPERDISVALLTTGKLMVGVHMPALLGLQSAISGNCPKLGLQQQEDRLLAVGMC
ncbi:MAG TPA: serine hydrolase domain-containing protein [Steroidobacteraceae bacterium]|nr:serine hydrolase domain-containing protein [Steroidobacteraceae bacterium]